MRLNKNEARLARFFTDREGDGVLENISSIDLFDQGLLDSLDMVSLALFIEREFQKKIDLTDPKTLTAMRRFDTLSKFLFG